MTNFLTLEDAISTYGLNCHLVTVSNSGPHSCPVKLDPLNDGLYCSVGDTAAKNVNQTPGVSLTWSPLQKSGYALILNALASPFSGQTTGSAGNQIRLRLTKAVLHRAGTKPTEQRSACQSDCIPLSYAHCWGA